MAETIGWLTDKIIVSELKIYHMHEQTERQDADALHRKQCKKKLEVLKLQRDDLKVELVKLLGDTAAGKVRPKIYRQFKMYNDSSFRAKQS